MSDEGPTTATILFTDVVASTEMRTALGEERADSVRREHHHLLEQCVAGHRGRIVKGTGDGVMAAFTSASDALSSAVEMQRAIDRHNREARGQPTLLVRIGLSVGDVAWDDNDCFGTPVIEASRIQAEAGAGRILCSEFVRMMARGRGGHTFVEVGPFVLKGLPEPLVLFDVAWAQEEDGRRDEVPFPPELSVDRGTPFVSRKSERLAMKRFLTEREHGRAGSIWLFGEPGIGKSRLAAEVAHEAHIGGAAVLFGRCDEDHRVALQPFIEALQSFVRALPDDQLMARLGPDPASLARLVPTLRARMGGLPAAAEVDAGSSYALYEAVRSWLESVSRGQPVVLVLDDIHWATRETLHLVRHCAGSSAEARLVIICTARNTEADRGAGMLEVIDDLRRRGAPHAVFELAGLDRADVSELVARTLGRDLDEDLESRSALVHGESAGNPLFVTALARTLGRADADPSSAGNVLAAVRRRVRSMPEEVLELLRVAAVIGAEFDLRVLSRVVGRDEIETLGMIESAVAARVVAESGANEFRWTHDLVRSALRGDLSDARRVRLHARIVEAIEESVGVPENIPALAHHSWEGRSVAGPDKAFRYSLAAAEAAIALYSYEDAAALLDRALELAGAMDDVSVARIRELKVVLGEVLVRGGKLYRAMSLLEEVSGECLAAGEGEMASRAAVAHEDGGFHQGIGETSWRLLAAALPLLEESDTREYVVSVAALGRALAISGRVEESRARSQAAVERARRTGDDRLLAEALVFLLSGYGLFLDHEVEGFTLVREARRLARPGDPRIYIHAVNQATWMSFKTVEPIGFRRERDELVALSRDMGEPFWEHTALHWVFVDEVMSGWLDRAEKVAQDMSAIAGRLEGMDMSGVQGIQMFLLRREQGRLREVEPALRAITRLAPQSSVWQVGLAALLAALRHHDEARGVLTAICANNFATVARDSTWTTNLVLLSDVATAVGAPAEADLLLRHIRAYDGLLTFPGIPWGVGHAARYKGMLAGAARRWEISERYFAEAVVAEAPMGSPFLHAHTLFEYGRMLWRRGDFARARPLLSEASALCTDYDLRGLADDIAYLQTE